MNEWKRFVDVGVERSRFHCPCYVTTLPHSTPRRTQIQTQTCSRSVGFCFWGDVGRLVRRYRFHEYVFYWKENTYVQQTANYFFKKRANLEVGHWYSCFDLLLTSALGFKARADPCTCMNSSDSSVDPLATNYSVGSAKIFIEPKHPAGTSIVSDICDLSKISDIAPLTLGSMEKSFFYHLCCVTQETYFSKDFWEIYI